VKLDLGRVSSNFGVVVGLVQDVNDPTGQGRIRVRFPWLPDDTDSGWAPIARPMAGKERGYYFMPEVGDEALLAFEHGDFSHPFVIGFLHNGVDVPPDDGIDVHVRRFKSVRGHLLQFDDRPGKEQVFLRTEGDYALSLDQMDGRIRISTAGGQEVVLHDTPKRIELKTAGGTSVKTMAGVTLVVGDTGVAVTSAAAPVQVDAVNATLNVAGNCTINAPTVTVNAAMVSVNSGVTSFSGVVQCATLVTNAVVSASYTPGAGNLW
jgi:uncharacterized protein involved in type VI secretion and phage assembly